MNGALTKHAPDANQENPMEIKIL